MPHYEMCCENCETTFEEHRTISDGPRKRCPKCKKGEPIFHQVYDKRADIFIVKGNPTTFGQQSEINAKRLGKEQMALREEADRNRFKKATGKLPPGATRLERPKENPWWRDSDKPLDLSKISDTQRYIETGQK